MIADTAVCAICDGTGFKPAPDDPKRVMRCDCKRRDRVAAGVPHEFQKATFETYQVQVCNRAAAKTAKGFGERDLYLAGGIGSGKTHLACAVLNAHFQRTGTGLFVRTPKLMLDLQLTYRSDATREDQGEARALIDTLFGVSLLVLDDVGVEKGSEHTFRMLYTIYEERSDRGLRTIWTSNLGLKELGEFLGDLRLSSRIAQRADVVFITCPDRRIQPRLIGGRDAD